MKKEEFHVFIESDANNGVYYSITTVSIYS